MEPLGNYLTFRNKPWNRPRKVLYSWKEPKKEPVKVLDPKNGTEEGTGEGSWLWLTLKRPIKIVFKEPLRSTGEWLNEGGNFLWALNIGDVWRQIDYIVFVFWREEGYTMKYSLSPREKAKGYPEGSVNISLYFPTWVTIKALSTTTPSWSFLEIHIGRVECPYCYESWAIRKILPSRLSNTGK